MARVATWIVAVGISLMIGSSALALDAVKKLNGPAISGTLRKVTKDEVSIDRTGGQQETIPIMEVEAIYFDGEPSTLRGIRTAVTNGLYTNALTSLGRIDMTAVEGKPEVKKEIEYYRALCEGKIALAGGGKIDEAGRKLVQFVTANPDSHHTYAANELIGDLLVASGKYDAAKPYYQVLTSSRFPELQMRAGVSLGRAQLAQAKYSDAEVEFDKVLALTRGQSSSLAKDLGFAASLGKAACLAEQGQAEEAIKQIETIVQGLSPEAVDVRAQAYLTLGRAYEAKGAKKEALLAYLHIDLLYPTHPQSHSAALKRLSVLWTELGKPQRSLQAAQILNDRYGSSAN